MIDITSLNNFIATAKKFTTTKKILLMVATLAALAFLLFGCSTNRSFSVSVDKAEKVNVHYTDSIGATNPL